MLCDKAHQLVKEAKRGADGQHMVAYNDELVRLVVEEMCGLFEQNRLSVAVMDQHDSAVADSATATGSSSSSWDRTVAVWVRHAAIERDRRCLLAYLWQRARLVAQLRWSFGAALPTDLRAGLCDSELRWFGDYSRCLARYMGSLGSAGLDLAGCRSPPKHLYIEVRVVDDYGEFETQDGDVVLLKKNSVHFLPRAHCEHLIQLGVLQHVTH